MTTSLSQDEIARIKKQLNQRIKRCVLFAIVISMALFIVQFPLNGFSILFQCILPAWFFLIISVIFCVHSAIKKDPAAKVVSQIKDSSLGEFSYDDDWFSFHQRREDANSNIPN